MVGELDALINDMSASLVELKKLEEQIKKESSELNQELLDGGHAMVEVLLHMKKD